MHNVIPSPSQNSGVRRCPLQRSTGPRDGEETRQTQVRTLPPPENTESQPTHALGKRRTNSIPQSQEERPAHRLRGRGPRLGVSQGSTGRCFDGARDTCVRRGDGVCWRIYTSF